MTRLKKVRRVFTYGAAALGLIVLYRFTRPVLFYIPSDCNCSDYSDRVDGFAILNPLRNRAPERAADGFLADVRDGRRSTHATELLASEMENPRRHLKWHLQFRENQGNRVLLYYKLDNNGAASGVSEYGSEGMIEVEKINGNWEAVSFDAVW